VRTGQEISEMISFGPFNKQIPSKFVPLSRQTSSASESFKVRNVCTSYLYIQAEMDLNCCRDFARARPPLWISMMPYQRAYLRRSRLFPNTYQIVIPYDKSLRIPCLNVVTTAYVGIHWHRTCESKTLAARSGL